MTKVKMIPTIFVTVVALAAVWILFPFHRGGPDDPRAKAVQVIVKFLPAKRSGCPIREGGRLTDVVSIFLTVGSQIDPTRRVCSSPWSKTVYATPGQVVEVTAEQFFGSTLGCSIQQAGHPLVTNGKMGPSQVSCKHVVGD